MKAKWALSLAGLLLAASPTQAHHSFAAEFDSKMFMLEGTVHRIEWMNPHVWIYVDVTDAGGQVTEWACEGGAPNGLIGNGWTRHSLKPGDHVKMAAYHAKDRPNVCKARYVQLSDGRKLFMGGVGDGLPPTQ